MASDIRCMKMQTKVGDERDKCLHWLGGRNQLDKHQCEVEKGTNGTGNWLLRNDTYRSWKANPGQLLWLNGIGGSPRQTSRIFLANRSFSRVWQDGIMVCSRLFSKCRS